MDEIVEKLQEVRSEMVVLQGACRLLRDATQALEENVAKLLVSLNEMRH